MTIKEARIYARKILNNKTPSLELDILVILAELLNQNTSYVLAHPEKKLPSKKIFFKQIKKRSKGLPIAYITGKKEFYGLDFFVNKNVLIPKPDTEILVERAITIAKTSNTKDFNILDVCTGSGCVAISIKNNCKNANVYAFDISKKALKVAKKNSKNLTNNKIIFFKQNLKKSLEPKKLKKISTPPFYNLIVANPPYVPTKDAKNLLKDGRKEPFLALNGGEKGLNLIESLIKNSNQLLKTKSHILIETGDYNAEETKNLLKKNGFNDIIIHKDLANQKRVVEGVKDEF